MPWLRLCIMGLIVHRCPAGDVSGGLARGTTLRLNGGAGSRAGLPFGTDSTEPILRGREEWEHHDADGEGVRVEGMKVTAANSSRFRTQSPDTSTAGDGSRRPRDVTPSTPRTPRTPTPISPRPDARETLVEMTGESSLSRGPVLSSHDPDAAASEDAGKQESNRERGEEGVNVWEECERTFPEYAVAYDECLTQQDFVDQQVQLAAEYGKQCEIVKVATCPKDTDTHATGNLTALTFWIGQGGRVNSMDSRGYQPLHWVSTHTYHLYTDKDGQHSQG